MTPPIHPLWMLPFALLLASIALMPFIHRHWWERYYPVVALALGTIAASYYFFVADSVHRWAVAMEDYGGFIVLLASLYIVSGGIVIHVARKATPLANCVLLLLGAVIANIFGTTGASMVLIRPYLRMNQGHIRPFHVVFFIFIVSNVGGMLTPIGDPPLFLGYLNGVPFWWVLEHCRWIWLASVMILLIVFFIIDTLEHRKTQRHAPQRDSGPTVSIPGIHNVLFIGAIVAAVFRPGFFETLHAGQGWGRLLLTRELLMTAATVASLALTGKSTYQRNEFTYGPIREVAILFLGIFSTMALALQWLNVNAHSLPLNTAGQFYFTSGTLWSVLDNAPTYLTFLELELGKLDRAQVDTAAAELNKMADQRKLEVDPTLDPQVRQALAAIVEYHGDAVLNRSVSRNQLEVGFLVGDAKLNRFLVAISLGAVLFGACTYIGNGPNFMVKSIAESAGVNMPHFARYVYAYALAVLLPTYVIVWLIFLRPGP